MPLKKWTLKVVYEGTNEAKPVKGECNSKWEAKDEARLLFAFLKENRARTAGGADRRGECFDRIYIIAPNGRMQQFLDDFPLEGVPSMEIIT